MKVNNHYENVDLVASFFSEEETKVKQMNNFIKNNGLEKTELILNFFSMVECSGATVDGITPRNYMSDFMVNMLKAFEEFDNLEPKGLITQQFTALAQKCKEKGVKLLIGKNNDLQSIQFPKQVYKKAYIFVNISEDLVKKAMEDPIYVIQQEGNNVPEIKAIPLGNLVAGTMVANFDDPILIGKCAAYLLFHELFHANSFLNHVENYDWSTSAYKKTMEDSIHNYANTFGILEEQVNLMLNKLNRVDDLRNVTGAKTEQEIRVSGEYELLQALHPNKKIMRLYEGKFLDFSKGDVLNAAVNVARFENAPSNQIGYLQQDLNNKYLSWKLEKFLNDKKTQFNKFISNGTNDPYKTFVTKYTELNQLKNNLDNFIKMQEGQSLDFVKIDNSVWEAQADQYIQVITEKLEKIQKQEDIQSRTYISSK